MIWRGRTRRRETAMEEELDGLLLAALSRRWPKPNERRHSCVKHLRSAHLLTRVDMYAPTHNAAPTAYSSQVMETAYG
jgi:hypothetical protein